MSTTETQLPGPDKSSFQLISGKGVRRRSSDRGIVHARSTDASLTWSYTNSLVNGFDHPEVFIAGLDPFLADAVLSHILALVSTGRSFSPNECVEGLLHDFTCAFRDMSASAASLLLNQEREACALQLVYPDHKNRLPWEAGYNRSWRTVQPLFFEGHINGDVEIRFLKAAVDQPEIDERRRPQRESSPIDIAARR
jgi:hypothetical protein